MDAHDLPEHERHALRWRKGGAVWRGRFPAFYHAVRLSICLVYIYNSPTAFCTVSVLLFFSGIPTAEKPQARRVFLSGDADAWATYRTYLDETSILIPLPPALYRPLPKTVKRTVLLDFPFYQFDEAGAGAGAEGAGDPATRPEESRL